ncbi:hypothetical protein TVWG_00019 [Tetraselmis viridis virus N1]|uniref:Uncharacterized protein n=1 Tax=Tetraselmis viridis virus S1 TaxID=756285 RepID=M4QZE9_9VIRU|nr:hypothetical protein TVSG_00007 [Tetraselmis viridis virus S1]AET84784.1 hypothetical protein TVWG_00019 [Tetraselmis viridis virus N1]AGH30807.1 hypothetical protein TVSG_00007 [Tetraselmis viridis virus S1]
MASERRHALTCPCKECTFKKDVWKRRVDKPEPKKDPVTEFDLNPRFGPCSGITRHRRALRALELNLGLDPDEARRILDAADKQYKFAQ